MEKESLHKELIYAKKYDSRAEGMESHLTSNLDWITVKTARSEYFMSDLKREYSYGNRHTDDQKYYSKPFCPLVKELMGHINEAYDCKFNVCFLNKYDNEQQHLGWHADDFEGMRKDQPIAVVSYGAEREIWWKPKNQKGVVPDAQKQLLNKGSLWIMPAGFQDSYFHKIPKHSRPCGPRISLTFRSFK